MARSRMRRRQDAERQRIEAYEATLRRVFSAPRPAPDFDRAIQDAMRGFTGETIRHCGEWRPKLKTRDPGRLRLAAARHLFALYPVPPHLEQVWLDASELDEAETMLRRRWYVAAATGGSLHKAGAGEWLSRREVHRFLNPPGELRFMEAFWAAIAATYTDDPSVALRIARSSIARTPRADCAFWREVARFFCANPATVGEIDDLCDFIAAARERDPAFGLRGRTPGSLRRMSAEWHRDMAAVARIEAMRRRFAGHAATQDKSWAGAPLADWTWQPPGKEAKERREEYRMVQLTTAAGLVEESSAMHHCVWTYAGKCIAGQASIW